MTYSVAFIGRKERVFSDVKSYLEKLSEFEIVTFHEAKEFVRSCRTHKYHALIIYLDYFGPAQLRLLERLQNVYPELPVILLSQKIDRFCFQTAQWFHRKLILEHPTETTSMAGILVRMMKGENAVYRNHRRHTTLQYAHVVGLHATDEVNARILDLSTGGAQLQIFKGNFQPGDEIELKIPLSQINKTHSIKAKVMWVNREPTYSTHGQNTARLGLQFSA